VRGFSARRAVVPGNRPWVPGSLGVPLGRAFVRLVLRPAALAHVDFLEPLLRRIEHEHVTRLDLALAVRHPDVVAVRLLDAEHVDVLLTQLQLGECERQRHRRPSGSRIRDSGHLTEPVKAGTRRATRDFGVAV
jgi:hypothetical protein